MTAEIRPLGRRDIAAIAELHRAAFGRGGLQALGRGTVRRYYTWAIERDPAPAALGAYEDGRLVAFCIAGRFPAIFETFVASQRGYLALQLLLRPWLVFHPSARARLRLLAAHARRLVPRRGRSKGPPGSGGPAAPAAVPHLPFKVLAIATDPSRRRSGLGTALMHAAEEAARGRGANLMTLFVRSDNRDAIRLYERLGWERRMVGGTWYGEMLLDLRPRRPR